MTPEELNAFLNARGIPGFGQQPAAPAAPQPRQFGGFLGALVEMARRKHAAQQPPVTTPPIVAPQPAPTPVVPQTPRANPKPYVSQFDWSKFVNTGDG